MLFLLSLLFVAAYAQTSCSQGTWQCQDVTANYNYVECNTQGFCKCRDELGFVGDATTTSKCDCPTGFSVNWQGSNPYCIKFDDAVAYEKEQARISLLKQRVTTVYQSLIWPTPYAIINTLKTGVLKGSVWDEFEDYAIGQVDPVGSFTDKDGVVEYFYGSVWTGTSQVDWVNITKLIAEDNIVYVEAILHFINLNKYPGGNITTQYKLTQTGTFTFSERNLINSTNLVIHNLGWALNSTGKFNNPAAIIQNVCTYYMTPSITNCSVINDPQGWYGTMDNCTNFMRSIDFGTWDQVRANSVLCRYYHVALAIARPNVHCIHVGSTGGGKCVYEDYNDYYKVSY